MLLRAGDTTTGPVKKAIFAGQHDHRCFSEMPIALDQNTCLIPIQSWHNNIYKNNIRVVVRDHGHSLKPIRCGQNTIPGPRQERFGGFSNSVAVIDDHDFNRHRTLCLPESRNTSKYSAMCLLAAPPRYKHSPYSAASRPSGHRSVAQPYGGGDSKPAKC